MSNDLYTGQHCFHSAADILLDTVTGQLFLNRTFRSEKHQSMLGKGKFSDSRYRMLADPGVQAVSPEVTF